MYIARVRSSLASLLSLLSLVSLATGAACSGGGQAPDAPATASAEYDGMALLLRLFIAVAASPDTAAAAAGRRLAYFASRRPARRWSGPTPPESSWRWAPR